MEKLKNLTSNGKFVFHSKEVQGELKLAGGKSSLYLWGENNDFPVKAWEEEKLQDIDCIKGVLSDLTKVSLINCLAQGVNFRMVGAGEGIVHSASFFPHYAVFGKQHISRSEKTITKVDFVIDDGSVLFYDPDVFGLNINPPHSLIEQAVRHSKDGGGEIKIGENSYIVCHIGKKQIFEANTVCGRISAFHNPVLKMAGDHLSAETGTKVSVTLQFASPTILEEAIGRTFRVKRFFELLIGHPQNLVEFLLYKECGHEEPEILEVYGSGFSKNDLSENKRKHFADVLMRAFGSPKEFSRVLENWLMREEDEEWQHARGRFFSFFQTQNSYDLDRLIRAANMFDLLPGESVPAEKKLQKDIQIAYEESKKAFKKLPQSQERDKFLNALGWASKNSLKEKIRYRARLIVDEIGDEIPEQEFFTVTDEAVNCRNYYVHGDSGRTRIDYGKEDHIRVFLTNTLEFVFGVSDLIEAGWNIKVWKKETKTSIHPFSRYLDNYEENWRRLEKCLLKESHT